MLEKTDDFYDFRLRSGELLKDLVFIVGSPQAFSQVGALCLSYYDSV